MSLHVFANIVTPFGTAANNRGETEGNATTLQKLVWHGQPHTSVSAEAIRFALRRFLDGVEGVQTNRYWEESPPAHAWRNAGFSDWAQGNSTYADDDLLGFMSAEAAKEEASKGSANVRRSVLELTRAVSLTPWSGDVVFNAAAPGATPSAAKGEGQYPVPYMAEIHATRYQYGLSMTPGRLRNPERATLALEAIGGLSEVAGNQARFLFDFSPDAIVLRITEDPAPRLLYCFDSNDGGKTVGAQALLDRIQTGDIDPKELIVGIATPKSELRDSLAAAGVSEIHGVRRAIAAACDRVNESLTGSGTA